MGITYVYRFIDGKWQFVEQGGPQDDGQRYGSGKAPAVHQDSMDPLRNHADGKIYDSKSEFRKATKAAGCTEMGEVSADEVIKYTTRNKPTLSKEQRIEDIKRTMHELGYEI